MGAILKRFMRFFPLTNSGPRFCAQERVCRISLKLILAVRLVAITVTQTNENYLLLTLQYHPIYILYFIHSLWSIIWIRSVLQFIEGRYFVRGFKRSSSNVQLNSWKKLGSGRRGVGWDTRQTKVGGTPDCNDGSRSVGRVVGGGGREYLRDDDILPRKLSTSLHIYHSLDTCSAGYSVQLLKCYTSKKITSQNNDLFDESWCTI